MIKNERMQVLVIDDEAVIREYLQYVLEREGYLVTLSSNGDDGLKKFGLYNYDMVITDISMPGRDGIKTIIAMRNSRKPVKIIAMSGVAKSEWYLRIAEFYKADAGLEKPFVRDDLISVINEVMS